MLRESHKTNQINQTFLFLPPESVIFSARLFSPSSELGQEATFLLRTHTHTPTGVCACCEESGVVVVGDPSGDPLSNPSLNLGVALFESAG